MIKAAFIDALTRSRLAASVIYTGLVLSFLFVAGSSVIDIIARRDEAVSAADLLAQLDGRKPMSVRPGVHSEIAAATGSPFLQGATVTVAGAALLQRVAGAVSRFGGNTLSSQVEVQPNPSKAGFVSLVASIDIEQRGLQELLYDLEAGMPFLFIDQLDVQAPGSTGETGGKLRVLLGLSGQWQGAK